MTQNQKLRQEGFTILEVLIATMILGGGILVMANAWSGNFMRVRNARINNTMAGLLERKMTEYEVQAKEKLIGEFPEEDAGDFGAKFPGYKFTMKTQPFEMPSMTNAMTAKEGGADEMTLMIVKTISEYIKDAVKEMEVTVSYKGKGGHEIKQSATIYIVDYTKDIPMPAGMPGGGAGGLSGGASPGGGAAGGHSP
jgi:Tfp pilus assembly protein PilV